MNMASGRHSREKLPRSGYCSSALFSPRQPPTIRQVGLGDRDRNGARGGYFAVRFAVRKER